MNSFRKNHLIVYAAVLAVFISYGANSPRYDRFCGEVTANTAARLSQAHLYSSYFLVPGEGRYSSTQFLPFGKIFFDKVSYKELQRYASGPAGISDPAFHLPGRPGILLEQLCKFQI